MEVDLARGSQLIYVIPNIMMTIGDFFRNIQLTIVTRGYETWQNGEANFLITIGLIGRLSNTPNVAFAYEVSGVVDYLTSHGVIALPGRQYSARQLQGLNWVVRPTNIVVPLQPGEVSSSNLLDGRLSISFSNYKAAPLPQEATYNKNDDEVPSDEDELRLHTVAVLIEEEGLLVKRIYPSAALPRRATKGAADYDLPINRAQDIPTKGRTLLTTRLSIKTPRGTYARIAARSSATLKKGILIGAGVIDSDYRGEVKILAFNTTNQSIFLQKHECIAQLILENISTPEVYEVKSLDDTARGYGAFGSTSKDHMEGLQQQLTYTWPKTKNKQRWGTLGEPSGKFDYYVNYAIPKAAPDLQLSEPSWDDNPPPQSKQLADNIIKILCPPDVTSHHPATYGTYAGDTGSGPSLHRSIEYPMTKDDEFLATFFEDTSNSEAENIQNSLNAYFPDAMEGGGKELPYPTKIIPEIIAAGQELEEN
ncbi:hypothetical protein ZIOFF_002094 [Zingiber officinale]|uniref:dUTP diphosphatase n=1 Tax=Zingiber officinale TaxID=94328 RepID=A0A8J5LYV2_ZINOF|nr:hypothetical protein ZIOFF_002094 [Zingiber officinale]